MSESVYAVVVGSGVCGSLMASKLLEMQGGKVLMLEAGPDLKMTDPAWWFQFVATGDAPYKATYDLESDFSTSGVEQWRLDYGGRVQGRGGTTNHWGGWVPRFMPEDFQQFTNTGLGFDWPFKYEDLEPYYVLAENYFGVTGDSRTLNPPRSEPYPFEPAPYPISAAPLIKAFENQGISSHEHLAMARYGKEWNGNGPCRTTGTCGYCPVGGRFTGNQPLDSITSEQFEIRLDAPVSTVRMSNRSTAQGVTYVDKATGQSVEVDAQVVVLAAGAFETPKLLQRSTSSYWTNGIGNDNGLVGSFIVANQFFFVNGVAPSNPEQYEEELGFPNLCSRFFDSPATQKDGKAFLTMNYGKPTLDIAEKMAGGLTADQIRAATIGQMTWELYGNLAPIAHQENQISNASGFTRYGLPRTQIDTPLEMYSQTMMDKYIAGMAKILQDPALNCSDIKSGSYPQRGDHASCTTRMSTNPSQGVVDTSLRVHETQNLFIVGNSVLPTLPAANPTLTTVAILLKLLNQQEAIFKS